MESGNVPVETRINAILDYEVRKLGKCEIARKYGVGESTVRGWMHTRDYFVNRKLFQQLRIYKTFAQANT